MENMKTLAPSVFEAQGSVVKGNVKAGDQSSFWYNCVARSEDAGIIIGERTNIQDCAVLHTDTGYDLVLGDDVTVGHGAILHGCQIGDNTVVGMGSIIMNGAKVGKNSLVAAGSLIPQNKEFEEGMLIMGSPARAVRKLTDQEIESNKDNAMEYVVKSRELMKDRD